MRIETYDFSIRIIPESMNDKAYIDRCLLLKSNGDSISCTRRDKKGVYWDKLLSLSYIEVRPTFRDITLPDGGLCQHNDEVSAEPV